MTADLKPYPHYKPSGVEWLGDVPAHWEVRRLKNICRLAYGDSLSAENRADGTVPVYGSNGQVGVHSNPNTSGQCLIVGRKGSFGKVHYSAEPVFAIDTTFFVDRRHTGANIRWLYYLLVWLPLDAVSKDSAIPGLNREDAYRHIGCYPPLAEQAAIVRYLDHTDGRIRRYLRSRERLIELLKEYRQATIHETVTRGLDPDVPLKPSGVEWIGDIPAHWERRRLKQAVTLMMGQSPPGSECSDKPIGLPFLQGCAEFGERHPSPVQFCRAPKKVSPMGAILLSVRAPVGRLNIADQEYGIGRGLCALLPHQRVLQTAFARYQLEVLEPGLRLASTGSLYDAVSVGNVGNQPLLVPPLAEQAAIAAYLDKQTAAITAAMTRAQREFELLSEYRTRLIADVVTGQVDVREEGT